LLKKNLWRKHEPRFEFPIFKGINTRFSFSIRSNFKSITRLGLAIVFYKSLKSGFDHGLTQGIKNFFETLDEYLSLMFSFDKNNLRFRLVILSRDGQLLAEMPIAGKHPPGASIDLDIAKILSKINLPDDDYMAIVIMSRGIPNTIRSSPGSYSMTYFSTSVYTTYRTGGFARTLNDSKKKKQYGFRGINPKIVVNDKISSSLFLINHSSNPLYDKSAMPNVVLLRKDGKYLESNFGIIPPFGGVERSMEELFGNDVIEFLRPMGGKGTTITTCPGVSLASIHLRRLKNGNSMSIEHSRPTHTYLMYGKPEIIKNSSLLKDLLKTIMKCFIKKENKN
jgi:hypothetical protein